MNIPTPKATRRTRALRKASTDTERQIWERLRDRRYLGLKFRRQVAVGIYVVDFLCHEIALCIELDGGQHNDDEARRYDACRTEFLQSKGIKVLRYWNSDIKDNLSGVLEDIRQATVLLKEGRKKI